MLRMEKANPRNWTESLRAQSLGVFLSMSPPTLLCLCWEPGRVGYQKFTDVFIYFWESCMLDEGSATKLQPRLHSFHFFEASGKCWSVDCEFQACPVPLRGQAAGAGSPLGLLKAASAASRCRERLPDVNVSSLVPWGLCPKP